jgi:hypothetical protein
VVHPMGTDDAFQLSPVETEGTEELPECPDEDKVRPYEPTKSGAGDGNRTHGSSLGSLGITIIRRPPKLDSKRLTEVSANHATGAPTGPVAAMPPRKPASIS